MTGSKLLLVVSAVVGCASLSASAQVLFSDNFQSGAGNASNYSVNLGPGTNSATFGYDYSVMGIPSAPHSTGGTTVGLQVTANTSTANAALGGVTVSPLSQSFTGDYQVRFDAWANYGGGGTTELTTYGILNNTASAEYAGAANGLLFASSGDGGTTQDYRVYPASGTQAAPGGTPVTFAAGNDATGTATDSRQANNAYYTSRYAAGTVPAVQVTGGNANVPVAGAQGFAWHDVTITKTGNSVVWAIDGSTIATVDITGLTLGGTNLALGMADINATANASTFEFSVFDNLIVTSPEPTSLALLSLAGTGLLARRRRA